MGWTYIYVEIAYKLLFIILTYLAPLLTTACQYKNNRFKDDELYFWYSYFWWLIALLPVLLLLLHWSVGLDVQMFYDDGINYEDKNSYSVKKYWHSTMVWMLYILTASLGPAIRQNQSEIGLDGILLVLMDCCGLVYLLLYISLLSLETPFTNMSVSSHLFTLIAVVALTITGFITTIFLSSFKQVKQVAKNLVFIFSILFYFFVPIIIVKTIYGMFFHG